MLKNFMRLMDLGGVALQADQQLGFYSTVCYSDQHGHAPGYGPWMHQKAVEFLQALRQQMKARNSNAVFSYEAACEVWIQHVDVHMHRPYGPGAIPLFDYIYGEFALRYGGDDAMGLSHPEVECIKHETCFVNVVQRLVGFGHAEYDFDVNPHYPILKFMRNLVEAQRTFARDYLTFGRMLRPTDLQVAKTAVETTRSLIPDDESVDLPPVDVPRVLNTVWRAPHGKIGYILANSTGNPEPVTLTIYGEQQIPNFNSLQLVARSLRRKLSNAEFSGQSIRIDVPQRSAMLIEQG